MKKILAVKALNKSFDQVKVLENIDFMVNEGEFVAIMGPSGSGKSTLLYCLSGMDHPDSGHVVLCGEDIAKLNDLEMSAVRLKHMGFIFQQSHLLKNLTIRDNIVLPGFKADIKPREVVNQSAESLMKKMDITHIAHHDIRKVSGGQLQRAAICRALINEPDILFADEPTGALNSSASKEVMDILNGLNNEGTTIILVTHDAKVASRASRIVFIMDGHIKNEIQLEAYDFDETDNLSREKKLGLWLEAQGL